jgi:hypothetical protein
MTPPTEAEHMAALADLAGSTLPVDAMSSAERRDLLRLAYLREAKMRGVSWSAIAKALGAPSGTVAKRDAKILARRVQAVMLARKPLEEAQDGP